MDKREFIRKQNINAMVENKEIVYTDFGEVIKSLQQGKLVKRKDSEYIIIKQIDSNICKNIISKMTSLPDSAKQLILNTEKGNIEYKTQCLKFNIKDNIATYYIPDWNDIFATDWIILN